MMSSLPHLSQRIFNTPLAVHPSKLQVILSGIGGRFGVTEMDFDNLPFQMTVASKIQPGTKEIGYDNEHGVAIIGVHGTLVHKNGSLRAASGMTGYDAIRANLTAALKDRSVKAIAFDVDSGGGEVAGVFDIADMIYRARGEKPMMAILTDNAFSAAYAIASAADFVAVPQAGSAGSIGVITAHVDMSQKLEDEGVKVTLIHYGKHKALGSETMPLSDSALGKIQADVNRMGEMFVRLVARNRGLSIKSVRDQQASTYMADDAVRMGLADEVLAPEHAFEALVNSIR